MTAPPDSSPPTADTQLPDGWHRSGHDQISNAQGHRITKHHIRTETGLHPCYCAHAPSYCGTAPTLHRAIQLCTPTPP